MVESKNVTVGSVTKNFKILYAVGIGANLFIALAHIAYAVVTYDTVDEPALWFFSGALTIIFNAALNFICLKDCTKLNYITGMMVNLALLMFSVVLAIVVREAHIVCVAAIVCYTTATCYSHNNRCLQKRNFDQVRA